MLAVDSVGFELETVVEGLNQPVTFDVAPDGRVFVAEKEGTVAIVENGVRTGTFLDIRGRVNSFQDRGLLSLTLDPDFETNGYIYLNYAKEIDAVNPELNPDVDPSQLDQGSQPGGINALGEVIRVTASAADPNVADMSTQVVVHDGFFHVGGSHSVGDIDFDNDDNLIFTWGDGGFDVQARLSAQDPDDPRAKVYRINKETFEGVPGNPFYEAGDPDSQRSKVWALGVRNSWKITVDRPTGDVYIAEVTDSGPEEINVIRADGSTTLNLGWPWFTGDNPSNRGSEYDPANNLPPDFQYESPLTTLNKTESYFAIVGGAVYREDDTPADNYPDGFDGLYFFSEIGTGDLWVREPNGEQNRFGNLGGNEGIVDVQLGPDGNLWATSLFTGKIQRVVFTGEGDGIDQRVRASARASRTAGVGPLTVQFDATGSRGSQGQAVAYAWDFDSNGVIDSTDARPVHTYTTVGRTIATLTVTSGADSASQVVEIDVLDTEPLDNNLAIGKPTSQSSTRGGSELTGGIASRAVDGNTSGILVNQVLTDSLTHTLTERTPFWEIDLEQVADLSSIRLYNRNVLQSRLSNFYVMFSDTPISSGNPNAAVALPEVKHAFFAGSAGTFEDFDFTDFIDVNGTPISEQDFAGRYLRVQLTSQSGILSLGEVQVFGTAGPIARFFDLAEPRLLQPGEDYPVQIDAYDSGGSIANVQLFLDDVLIRQENFGPYEWLTDPALQNLATGEYTLRAVATDNEGLQATVSRTIAVGVEGDYNRDGVVDAADFTVWRDNLGLHVDPYTGADGDGDGTIGENDHAVWAANYGRTDTDIPDPGGDIHAADFAGVQITGTEQGDSFDDITVRFEPLSGGPAVVLFSEDFSGYDGDRLDDPTLDGGWEAVQAGGARLVSFDDDHARGAGASRNLTTFDTAPLIEEGILTLEMVTRVREQFLQNTALIDANGQPIFAVGNLDNEAGSGFEISTAAGLTFTLGDTASAPVSFSAHRYFDLRVVYNTSTRTGTVEIAPGSITQSPDGPYELIGSFSNPALALATTGAADAAALALALSEEVEAASSPAVRVQPIDNRRGELDLLSASLGGARPESGEAVDFEHEDDADEIDDAIEELAAEEFGLPL